MKRSSVGFVLVIRQQLFKCQENWTRLMWESIDQNSPMWLRSFAEIFQRWMCCVESCAIKILVHYFMRSITTNVYHDPLTKYVLPQLDSLQQSLTSKLVSYKIEDYMFVNSWIKHFQTDQLEVITQLSSTLVHQIFLSWTSFSEVLFKIFWDILYWTKIRDIINLKQKIGDTIATSDEDMVQQTWQEIEYRLCLSCNYSNGAHRLNEA